MDLNKGHLGAAMGMAIAWNSLCGFVGDRARTVANRWRSFRPPTPRARPTLDDLNSLSRRERVDIGLDPLDAPCVARDTWLDFRNRV